VRPNKIMPFRSNCTGQTNTHTTFEQSVNFGKISVALAVNWASHKLKRNEKQFASNLSNWVNRRYAIIWLQRKCHCPTTQNVWQIKENPISAQTRTLKLRLGYSGDKKCILTQNMCTFQLWFWRNWCFYRVDERSCVCSHRLLCCDDLHKGSSI